MYGKGVSRIAEVLDLAVEYDIIQKEEAGFAMTGNPLVRVPTLPCNS